MNNEEKYPKQTMWIRWLSLFIPSLISLASLILSVMTRFTVNDVRDSNEQAYKNIENRIETVINNQQSVDVIEAREKDVLIKTSDGKWIVVPMIEKEDIEFSSQITEKKYKANEINLQRIDVGNDKGDDWNSRESFTYTIPFLSINQNKMVSLKTYIESIDVIFKIYNSKKELFGDYTTEIYDKNNEYRYLNVFEQITPQYQFVTKEVDDGIEDIKITVNISFKVSDQKFTIPYYFDEWVQVKQDYSL